MGNLTIATIFIVTLNILMWFSSISMLTINPTGSVCYNLEGSIIDNAVTQTGNYSYVLDNDILDQLPTAQSQSVSSGSTGITFTDIFNNILGWFKSAPGIKYIYGVISAPYNILKCMNLPGQFVAGIGTLWYLVTFLVLVAFLWGRNQ